MFIPPPSPTPGWATGEVCSERTATLRTGMQRILGAGRSGLGRALERPVDLDEHLLLALADRRVTQDFGHEIGVTLPGLENPSSHVERLGGDAQAPGDGLQDLGA